MAFFNARQILKDSDEEIIPRNLLFEELRPGILYFHEAGIIAGNH